MPFDRFMEIPLSYRLQPGVGRAFLLATCITLTALLDIDKINVAIDNIRQPLDRRRREEDVIRAG